MNLKFKHLGVAVPDIAKALPLYEDILGAVGRYIEDVKNLDFPNEKEQY